MTAATRALSSPGRARTLSTVAAFIRRDVAIARSFRLPFVFDTLFGVLQLVVYFFLSRTFTDSDLADLSGAPDYFAFAVVGVVITLVIEAAIQGVSERVREGQLSGSLETLLAQPVGLTQTCLGFTAFPFVFAVLRAVFYLAIAALFMNFETGQSDWLGLSLILLATAAAMSSLGVLAGAALVVFKRGDSIVGLAVFAMTLITGAVFPVSALPAWLESLGSVLPLRLAFDGARDALFVGSGWGSEVVGLAAFAVVTVPLSIWVFSRSIDAARRAGSLGEY